MEKDMKKILGILGGMGPAATADLYAKIVALTDASSDGDHIRTIIDSNVNIPDRTAAILAGGENPLEEMEAALDNLVCSGAEVIIIPCNTAHYFLPSLKEYAETEYVVEKRAEEDLEILVDGHVQTGSVEAECAPGEFAPGECALNLEFVSMINETAKACAKRNPQRAAILATKGTLESGLYQRALDAQGVEYIVPDEDGKDILMHVIYQGVKAGADPSTYLPGFRELLDRLAGQGADYFMLACTELPIAFAQLMETDGMHAAKDFDVPPEDTRAGASDEAAKYSTIDPTEELAKSAILACGYQLKNN